eukprot:2799972-Prymnesium_polylepis.1
MAPLWAAPALVAAGESSGGDGEVRPASLPTPAALRRSSARPLPQSELRLNALAGRHSRGGGAVVEAQVSDRGAPRVRRIRPPRHFALKISRRTPTVRTTRRLSRLHCVTLGVGCRSLCC